MSSIDSQLDSILNKFSIARDYPALAYEESKDEARAAIHLLILKERREELQSLGEWAKPEPYYSDRIAQLNARIGGSNHE